MMDTDCIVHPPLQSLHYSYVRNFQDKNNSSLDVEHTARIIIHAHGDDQASMQVHYNINLSNEPQANHVFPRTPLTLPIPLVPRREVEGALNRLELEEVVAGVDEVAVELAPLDTPTPRPRPLEVVLVVTRVAASALLLSSSSAFRAAAAFLSCSSCSRRSAASCLAWASSSISAMS